MGTNMRAADAAMNRRLYHTAAGNVSVKKRRSPRVDEGRMPYSAALADATRVVSRAVSPGSS